MIVESHTVFAIIDRLRAMLPEKMTNSVLHYLNRPADLTRDALKVIHPYGLYLVQYVESPESEADETLLFGVYTVTIGLEQSNKLGRAAKMIVPGLAPFGAHQLKLHSDKPESQEEDVMVRCISFRLLNPTLPLSDARIAAKIAELEI